MPARLQKGLHPSACDLMPVGDHQRVRSAPRGSRQDKRAVRRDPNEGLCETRRTITFRGHALLPG
jgi:hypothetical protein